MVNIILIINIFCLIVWITLLINAIIAKIKKKGFSDTLAILGFFICVLHFAEKIVVTLW